MIDRVSFSSISDFFTCPFYYKLIHIDKLKGFEGNIHTAFGSAIHLISENLLQNKIKEEERNDLFDVAFLEELKKISHKETKNNKDFIHELRVQGKGLFLEIIPSFESYFGKYDIINIEEQLLENIEQFETKLKFKGFIDIVLKSESGRYHIIDLKTTSWGWDARKKSDKKVIYQLIFYKIYYAQKHVIDLKNIDCHFALMKRTAKKNKIELFKVTSGEKRMKNAIEYLKICVPSIEQGKFMKNKLSCQNCKFFRTEHCKK